MLNSEMRQQVLQAEINQLENQMDQYHKQMAQIAVQQELAQIKLKALRELLPTRSKGAASDRVMQPGSLRGMGFRDAVVAVLKDSKKGLRPREISKQMLARGFHYSASTPISTRLSNDLSKMRQSGKVRKRGDMYFSNT